MIHRKAGPALREACRAQLAERTAESRTLWAGTAPLVTAAHALPATRVLHVTGPKVTHGLAPSLSQRRALEQCYTLCLDSALLLPPGDRVIAFCCISTGLYGYPGEDAARVALKACLRWVERICLIVAKTWLFGVLKVGPGAPGRAGCRRVRLLSAAGRLDFVPLN